MSANSNRFVKNSKTLRFLIHGKFSETTELHCAIARGLIKFWQEKTPRTTQRTTCSKRSGIEFKIL